MHITNLYKSKRASLGLSFGLQTCCLNVSWQYLPHIFKALLGPVLFKELIECLSVRMLLILKGVLQNFPGGLAPTPPPPILLKSDPHLKHVRSYCIMDLSTQKYMNANWQSIILKLHTTHRMGDQRLPIKINLVLLGFSVLT